MLKNWAVRQLASALSDYVEGISTETVQASLGRDIGRLNLTGARVNPQAVEQYGLEVLRSELSIDAEVPWRHLSSQPTTLTVCSLRLELRLSRRKDATQNSSEAKEEQVKKLEDELMASAEEAQEGGGFVFGRVARLSHAILRQLRVSIGRLEAVVHHQQPGKSPVTIALGESGLESVGPDWQSLPTDETDLRKVLRLSGFEAKLGGRDLRLFGPLAVQARLLHSPEQALVKLWLELPQEADTAFQISPEALQELRSWFDWVVAEFLQDSGQGRELSEAAGLRYAAVYGSKLKGEPFDEELLAKLEATASVKWLAQWRCQSRLEGGEAEAADGHGPERVESQWRSWLHWAKGDTETKETKETKEPKEKETKEKETKEKETKDQIPPKEAWPEDSDLHFSAALLDEVVTEELPELSTPTRFEVDMLISQYTALCAASGGLLKASVGGAAFSLDVATASGSESARKLCLTVKLASMSISLDDQPLVQLLERAGAERASFERQASHDRRLSPGAGLQFQVHADQRPSSPLDVAVTLLGEPVQVELAPMTLHGTLRSIQDAVNAWRSPMSLAPEEEEVSEPEGPDRPDVEESQAVKHAKAAASVAGLDAIHLSLSVEVEAPILRLQTWHDGSALELHLGCFSAKTLQQDRLQFSESEGLSMLLQEAQSIDPRAFAVICELRDTRIKVMELGERDRFAYEPSTIVLGAALTGAGRQIHAEASRMRCHIDPGLLHLIGQLQVGLDFALAPLSGNVRAPPSVQRTTSRRRRASIKPEGPPLKFNLRTGSFDVIWDPCGGGGFHDSSVKGRIAGVSLKVETGLRTSVVGNAQDAHMDCGDQRFVSIIGNLDVQADWSQQAVKLVPVV